MFSLRFEAISRFVGRLLLFSTGILVSLFVVTIAGAAIPTGSWATNPGLMRDSPLAYISLDSNIQSPLSLVVDLPPVPRLHAAFYTNIWHTAPIKTWSLIAAIGVVFMGILYLLLRQVHFGMSEEIFP